MDKSCATNRLYRSDGWWSILKIEGRVQSTPTFWESYKKVRNCIAQYEKGKFKFEENNKPGGKWILGGGHKVVSADVRKEFFAF